MIWKCVDEIVQGEDSRGKELKSRGKGSVICVDNWREKMTLSKSVWKRIRSSKRKLRECNEVAMQSAARGVWWQKKGQGFPIYLEGHSRFHWGWFHCSLRNEWNWYGAPRPLSLLEFGVLWSKSCLFLGEICLFKSSKDFGASHPLIKEIILATWGHWKYMLVGDCLCGGNSSVSSESLLWSSCFTLLFLCIVLLMEGYWLEVASNFIWTVVSL